MKKYKAFTEGAKVSVYNDGIRYICYVRCGNDDDDDIVDLDDEDTQLMSKNPLIEVVPERYYWHDNADLYAFAVHVYQVKRLKDQAPI